MKHLRSLLTVWHEFASLWCGIKSLHGLNNLFHMYKLTLQRGKQSEL